jgi:elongation factor P
MATVDTSEFRKGLNIEVEGKPYTIIWFQHHKPGKGGAIMRVKLKNLRTGARIDRTFKAGERFKELEVERKKRQFIYREGTEYYFMDMETFEQVSLPENLIAEERKYLKEGLEVDLIYLEGELVGIELPLTVVLEVTYTEPGFKGDTATSATKPATLETGMQLQVPLFIEKGDLIRVDTREEKYIERVSK